MKYILLCAMLLSGHSALSCDQKIYDSLYKRIVREALWSKKDMLTTMNERNRAIRFLRALCQGQRSSYEGKK